jgi:hypothetical protein
MYRKQIEEDPPIPWRLLADLVEQGWTQDGLEAWLQPLRNLSQYTPDGLEAIVASMVEHRDDWKPSQAHEGEEEAAA